MVIDERSTVDLVMRLMAIEGKSGFEAQIADEVEQRLLAAGAQPAWLKRDSAHRRTPVLGETGNLILKLPGTLKQPRRLLASHLDTVPICVGSKPVRRQQMITSADPNTGLGADNRAGVAVILNAACQILEQGLPHPPLTFCWFVQEETGLQGSRCMTRSAVGKPAFCFNWDGGACDKLTIGATGGYRMLIHVRGIASHAGGAPEHGVSAIAVAALAIADLHENGWHGLIQKGQHAGTSNVGYVHGGEATNVVTDHVTLKAEARSHDPRFRKRIVTEIEKAFRRAAKSVKNVLGAMGDVTIDGQLDYESFLLDKQEPCVQMAAAAVQAIGRVPVYAIANGGLDANWLTAHGLPTVSLGCGQLNQHMVQEALDVEQFHDACRIALRIATAS